jgi:KaiC/GvpD/RAD55 family RecA-like ATPase
LKKGRLISLLVSTGLEQLDSVLGGDGYPERSSILVAGAPGVGKEALGYWFTRSGLLSGDHCIYVTHLAVSEVLEDMKGFHVPTDRLPVWLAPDQEGKKHLDVSDLTSLSSNIKEAVREGAGKRIRVVSDILSPLLMLNSADTIYKLFGQLLSASKQSNSVFLSTIEEGMHQPQVLSAMEQLFDGVLELRLYEEGPRVDPLFRVRKMRGLTPRPKYYTYEFSKGNMEIKAYAR